MTIQRELVRLVAATVLPAGIAAELLIAYSYERQRTIIEQRTLETARALMQAVDRELAGGRTPPMRWSVPDTWVTDYSEDMGNSFASKGLSAHSTRPVS